MQSTKFHPAQEPVNHADNSSNHKRADTKWILKQAGIEGLSQHAQGPLFYIFDYNSNRYLYIYATFNEVLNSGMDNLKKSGIFFPKGICHKNDCKIYNEKILPGEQAFLSRQTVNRYSDFSFSFNYRIAVEKDQWRTVLQKTTYLTITEQAEPLAAIIYITDITQFKEDSRMIHIVEEINHHTETPEVKLLLKSIYNPDREAKILSKREVEILKLVHDGLSSKRIAEKLYVSVNTIHNHRKNMLVKTRTKNTSELLGYAIKKGLLEGA